MDNGRNQGFLLEDYRLFHLSSPRGTVHRAEMRREEPYERIILYILPAFLEGLSTASSQLVEIFSHSPVLRSGGRPAHPPGPEAGKGQTEVEE